MTHCKKSAIKCSRMNSRSALLHLILAIGVPPMPLIKAISKTYTCNVIKYQRYKITFGTVFDHLSPEMVKFRIISCLAFYFKICLRLQNV